MSLHRTCCWTLCVILFLHEFIHGVLLNTLFDLFPSWLYNGRVDEHWVLCISFMILHGTCWRTLWLMFFHHEFWRDVLMNILFDLFSSWVYTGRVDEHFVWSFSFMSLHRTCWWTLCLIFFLHDCTMDVLMNTEFYVFPSWFYTGRVDEHSGWCFSIMSFDGTCWWTFCVIFCPHESTQDVLMNTLFDLFPSWVYTGRVDEHFVWSFFFISLHGTCWGTLCLIVFRHEFTQDVLMNTLFDLFPSWVYTGRGD
jgi:hypothetical protein